MRKRKFGVAVASAAALAIATLALPSLAIQAGAHKASNPTSTFTVTATGTNAMSVGTSKFAATQTATGAASTGTGPHGVVPSFNSPGGRLPVHTVGEGENIAGSPGTRGKGHQASGKNASASAPSPAVATPITGTAGGATSAAGISAYDEGLLHPVTKGTTKTPLPGVDVEPPDQGLCTNGTDVMEVNNEVMQVFTASSMTALGGNGMALERLFKTPEIFNGTGHSGVNVQGDPRCYYDPASNRWFASQIWLDESGKLSTGFGWSGVFLAVSATTNPMGTWHVWFIPDMNDLRATTTCNNLAFTTLPGVTHKHGKANPCFGDQPLLGMNGNAVYISTNEYSLYANTLGGAANVYFLSKADLLAGTAPQIFWAHPGTTVARPGAPAANTVHHFPWYSVVPAVSDGTYIAANNGTFYAVSAVTFTTTGGSQAAIWQFTNTGAVTAAPGGKHSPPAHVTGAVTEFTTATYAEPALAKQKAGTIPLGNNWRLISNATTPTGRLYATTVKPMPEGKIATNTDRVTSAAYDPATGAVWGGINTAVTATKSSTGIAWVTAVPSGTGATLTASTAHSGIFAATGANIFFPGITFTNSGKGLMDFALTGTTNFPSTGFTLLGATGPAAIHVARAGVGPEDGFTEYQYETTAVSFKYRPRWGDYSTSVSSGTTFFFATNVINQTCSTATYRTTFTCGGTRDRTANWGTSVNSLPAG